ncbi:MAG: DUF1592 domain-containing protein [Myxococcales bacterium]|nr:DUF1592 domain-containing protein [Myxococcales bacterium]
MWLAWMFMGCRSAEPPARVVVHRLNRAEYDNTVRDLFGTDLKPARTFPADDFAVGFDNQAHALSLSPLHIELLDSSADDLLDELFAVGTVPPQHWTFEAEGTEVSADHGNVWDSTGWVLWVEGAIDAVVWAPSAGDYTIDVAAFAMQAGEEIANLAIRVDGADVASFDVEASYDGQLGVPASHAVRLSLTQGRHVISAAYTNEFKDPELSDDGPAVGYDRNLIVDRITVTGPLDVPREPHPGREVVLVCDPAEIGEAACAEQIVRTFGPRAWRRPLTEGELDRKLALYGAARGAGGDWIEGIRTVVKAFLVSPHFLYRVELPARPGAGHSVSSIGLASRLSYFLWSSMPDDRLLDLGASGALRDPAVLETEARRMLRDPKARALVENLGGQWLGIRKLDDASPNGDLYPHFDEGLRRSMKLELQALGEAILLSDRSLLDLLTTEDTFVDARLRDYYGLPASTPLAPEMATVPDRAGWFTRAGLLTALSHPNRTSPVLRGKWVLENLMCDEPDPPPDSVDLQLAEDVPTNDPSEIPTAREQLAEHVANPGCAFCHNAMDPIGLSLEGFDAVGAARSTDAQGRPIDITGVLPGAGAFDGPRELADLLAVDERIPACAVERTFTYALGRPPMANPDFDSDKDDPEEEYVDSDAATLAEIEEAFVASGYRFSEIVVGIVRSEAFRHQGPSVVEGTP